MEEWRKGYGRIFCSGFHAHRSLSLLFYPKVALTNPQSHPLPLTTLLRHNSGAAQEMVTDIAKNRLDE